MNNLVGSTKPEHRAALQRLRAELEKWIEESNDQGRIPEPPQVTARKGATKATTPDAEPKGKKAKAKQAAEK